MMKLVVVACLVAATTAVAGLEMLKLAAILIAAGIELADWKAQGGCSVEQMQTPH